VATVTSVPTGSWANGHQLRRLVSLGDCRQGRPDSLREIGCAIGLQCRLVGLLSVRRDATTIVLFTGLFLTGFGSSYYHLNPNDGTLFWDRLPMPLCFAAILAAVVEERVDARAGAMLLRPLLAIGIFSLLLWRWTDDLRLYALAQFFPFLALVLILHFFRRNIPAHRIGSPLRRSMHSPRRWSILTRRSSQKARF
jgi:hypothetical protein